MKVIFPEKLKEGDIVRVIAPSRSMSIINENVRDIAINRFYQLGLKLTFGEHVNENNEFGSSSVTSRLSDLHDAFADKRVKAVLSVIGGYNSNQLLDYLEWNVIANNPKIFCGYSDITVLFNSIFTKTGLVTYYGPHFSTFGQKKYFDYTLNFFKNCLFSTAPYDVIPSRTWSDDEWYVDQNKRQSQKNEGYWIFNHGRANGMILGGNFGSLRLLQGTPFMPNLKESILFLEDDEETQPYDFDRELQSLIQANLLVHVRGIVIGRFQRKSNLTYELLRKIIETKKILQGIPIVGNVDFGHTDPKISFPIGGNCSLFVEDKVTLTISRH